MKIKTYKSICKNINKTQNKGDFLTDRYGQPWSIPQDGHNHRFRYVAKKRQTMDIDGTMVRGRWYNKYFELSSNRGIAAKNHKKSFDH